jgi:hypothetical protein
MAKSLKKDPKKEDPKIDTPKEGDPVELPADHVNIGFMHKMNSGIIRVGSVILEKDKHKIHGAHTLQAVLEELNLDYWNNKERKPDVTIFNMFEVHQNFVSATVSKGWASWALKLKRNEVA